MKHPFMVMAAGALLSVHSALALAQQPTGDMVTTVEKSPGQAEMVQTKEAVATVESVDVGKREVTLRDSAGRLHPLVAGPEVRNLEQVRVGDRVVVRYTEALSLKLVKGGKELRSKKVVSDSARAPKGDRPGATVTEQVHVTADVVAVNPKTRMVTLRGPEHVVDLLVNDPEQLKQIKVGDQIEAVYTEALALSMKPAPAAK